jgi:hypothetical protein
MAGLGASRACATLARMPSMQRRTFLTATGLTALSASSASAMLTRTLRKPYDLIQL